jgi:hypothetical protein
VRATHRCGDLDEIPRSPEINELPNTELLGVLPPVGSHRTITDYFQLYPDLTPYPCDSIQEQPERLDRDQPSNE